MKPGFPGGDSEPWYRQFWPWFLILLPASVVVAGLFTLYIANEGADDLVVDDYYKDGLAINRQLEKKQRSIDLGITATLHVSDSHVTARVTGPVDDATLTLLLSHPLESDRDFTVVLARIAPGIFQAVLPAEIAPRWHWILMSGQPDAWRLDGDIAAHDIGNAVIE
ncbi:MAG: FixH family protein [Pseudomonadales bacterium]|nr:FixH family protein [Halioglobus sp.]MCP5123372.1 FixH family protein [Pseudomonadales bacterium]MCP5193022.1 FixH family protein [Pseudomonadales bacterium]